MPRFGVLDIHHWIADGLMAVFFLLVGLEVKREWYDGRLSTPAERGLPFVPAGAGMAVPARVYLLVPRLDPALVPAVDEVAVEYDKAKADPARRHVRFGPADRRAATGPVFLRLYRRHRLAGRPSLALPRSDRI